MNEKIIEKHIDEIVAGDAVFHDGKIRTVSENNIKKDAFMGKSIFGDSYKMGYEKVKVVVYR